MVQLSTPWGDRPWPLTGEWAPREALFVNYFDLLLLITLANVYWFSKFKNTEICIAWQKGLKQLHRIMHMTHFWDENAGLGNAKWMTHFVNTADDTHSQSSADLHQRHHLQKHTCDVAQVAWGMITNKLSVVTVNHVTWCMIMDKWSVLTATNGDQQLHNKC